MKRITKTEIRQTMLYYDYLRNLNSRRRNIDKEKCSAIVLNEVERLQSWLQDKRLNYTDNVCYFRDGGAMHHITVPFAQLEYLNKKTNPND